jgi:hypothetical protein
MTSEIEELEAALEALGDNINAWEAFKEKYGRTPQQVRNEAATKHLEALKVDVDDIVLELCKEERENYDDREIQIAVNDAVFSAITTLVHRGHLHERGLLGVPEGYVLVPIEPTEEMIEAGSRRVRAVREYPVCPGRS